VSDLILDFHFLGPDTGIIILHHHHHISHLGREPERDREGRTEAAKVKHKDDSLGIHHGADLLCLLFRCSRPHCGADSRTLHSAHTPPDADAHAVTHHGKHGVTPELVCWLVRMLDCYQQKRHHNKEVQAPCMGRFLISATPRKPQLHTSTPLRSIGI
jgi:hypothetical protein